MISPDLVLLLSSLLAIRWGIRLVKKFELRNVFTFLSRLYFVAVYSVITFAPPSEDLRILIRLGLVVMFLDEIYNWLVPPTISLIIEKWGRKHE